jgi:hypothetical protein
MTRKKEISQPPRDEANRRVNRGANGSNNWRADHSRRDGALQAQQ